MNDDLVTIDVREDIRAGREPFSIIMDAVAHLGARRSLRIIAPFEPTPLFHALAKQGFRHDSQQTASSDWQVTFLRSNSVAISSHVPDSATLRCESVPVEPEETADLDARGLEPPQPLVAILEAITALPAGVLLRALTDRRPMHLYSQLEERGFTGQSQEQADGSFITHIRHR